MTKKRTAIQEGQVVRRYLDLLGEDLRPHRSPEYLQARLDDIDAALDNGVAGGPIKRLTLMQKRLDLQADLAACEEGDRLADAEAAFVECAASFAERKGISYAAFRSFGVPVAVLREAGIAR